MYICKVEAGAERGVVGGQRVGRADFAMVFKTYFVPENAINVRIVDI